MSHETGYGEQMSITEAIENLAIACACEGVPGPTQIILPKATLDRITQIFEAKERWIQTPRLPSSPPQIFTIWTSSGPVGLVEG